MSHVGRFLLLGALALVGTGCTGGSAAKPALHRVLIRAFQFEPESLSVAVGDTVEWNNRDLVPHTATAKSGRWNSDTLLPAASWRTVVSAPGREPYGCQLHPTMVATLIVR